MRDREFWRVCKKLNNQERINVLRRVMAAPKEGLTVGEVADMVRLEQPATSVYLSQLERECGLLKSTRDGRYCVYRAEPDHDDVNVSALFKSLRRYFRDECKRFGPVNGRRPKAPAFLSILPALANEGRVQVIAFLRKFRSADKISIMEATGLNELNVRRHVACLIECGLVAVKGSKFVWKQPGDNLSKLFVSLSIK